MRIFLLLHIWDIFQMVEGFCFQAMILTKENSREQIKGCVHHSQAGVQRLWSLCSRAKSIKSSNRKISNCHWDYKSQITMHWDWDFVTHLKWGIWNFRISTSLSLKICNMSWPLAIFQNLRKGPLVGGLLLIECPLLDGWELALCASWGRLSVLHLYYIDALSRINQVMRGPI